MRNSPPAFDKVLDKYESQAAYPRQMTALTFNLNHSFYISLCSSPVGIFIDES